MKKGILFLFLTCSILAQSQTTDTAKVKAQIKELIAISQDLAESGDFEKSLLTQDTIEKLAFEIFGREGEDIANLLLNRANILRQKGAYSESEKWYLEALNLQEKWTGKENEDYAIILSNLAYLFYESGQYEKSEKYNIEAKGIRERVLGKDHIDYAATLNNIGILYWATGAYEKAKPVYLQALQLKEKILGKANRDFCGTQINIGALYLQLGNYEEAEKLLLEVKDIYEITLQDTLHGSYLNCIGNLSILYTNMGNYQQAEPYWIKILALFEIFFGKEHPQYARTLGGLGSMYGNMKQFDKAEETMNQALTIFENALGKEHTEYASHLSDMGAIYIAAGNFENAEKYILEAKTIFEKILGKDHFFYATTLSDLAYLYTLTNEHEKAESLFKEAKSILNKIVSEENTYYEKNLFDLGFLYYSMNRKEEAEPILLQASNLSQSLIIKSLHHLSERELSIYLNTFSARQDKILSFARSYQSKKAAGLVYDNSLFYKGFLLNAANQIKRLAISNPATSEKYNQLKAIDRRLAEEVTKSISERDQTLIYDLSKKINDLEKELARTVAGFSENLQQVKWQEVQQALKADEAAIEFVHFDFYEKEKTDNKFYAALLIKPDFDSPKFISLFEEKSLDSLLLLHQDRRSDYVNDLYSFAERGASAVEKPKATLYDLIWAPLENELDGVSTIYYSPSGLLHRLNLNAIPIDEDFSLSDQVKLVLLNTTRQLVLPDNKPQPNNSAMLFGGIQYEADSMFLAANSIDLNDVLASRGEQVENENRKLRTESWNYLRWTKKEVESISTILESNNHSVRLNTDYTATEESFIDINSYSKTPRILHIATHGFFFPDPEKHDQPLSSDEPVFKMSDHPMIRSGLILAGGNNTWQNKPAIQGMEDGILTAMEISQMDLSDTELVVLSACETGLGDIKGNEGVYGLQRAFKIAGVQNLIMSLWQVPDRETAQFMTTFYRHWLEDNLTIRAAFQKTQQEMKERFFNPYQWAGFVLLE